MTEDLLRSTLRDPERALPAWADPAGRVRRAAREQRRRRLATVAGVAVVAGGLAMLPSLLPADRPGPPAGEVTSPAPNRTGYPADLPVAGQIKVHDIRDASDVVLGGAPWALSRGQLVRVPLYTGERLPPPVAVGPATAVAVDHDKVWAATGAVVTRFDAGRAAGEATLPATVDALVARGAYAWVAAGDRVHRLDGTDGARRDGRAELSLDGEGRTRLVLADGVLWARRADGDGVLLTRIDPVRMTVTGTARLDGGPRDAPFTAGGGRVYLSTASSAAPEDGYLTVGGLAAVDARTLAVSPPSPAPYPKDLEYDRDGVWLLDLNGGLHRFGRDDLREQGKAVPLGGATAIAVHGARIFTAGDRVIYYQSMSWTARPEGLFTSCAQRQIRIRDQWYTPEALPKDLVEPIDEGTIYLDVPGRVEFVSVNREVIVYRPDRPRQAPPGCLPVS